MSNPKSKITFRNGDPDKYSNQNNNKSLVESLINSSFNSATENDFKSSRLGEIIRGHSTDREIRNKSHPKLKLNYSSSNHNEVNLSSTINFCQNNLNLSKNEKSVHRNSFNFNKFSSSFINSDFSVISLFQNNETVEKIESKNMFSNTSFVPVSKFKKYTYKIQGKDENGNEINKNPELDNSNLSDKQILDEIFNDNFGDVEEVKDLIYY
jgi:hypothetical protein